MGDPTKPDLPSVIRYAPKERAFEPAFGEPESLEAITAHIERHVGKVEMVFHEVVSDLVHIDLHWVKPTEERPFHTLVTSGMSDRAMTPPQGAEDYRYCELVLNLPEDWPMQHSEWLEDEGSYWPIRLTKGIARLPHEYQTWIWAGHSVGGGDHPEPYHSTTQQCAALLVPCITLPDEFGCLEASSEKRVYFFAVLPIYREELLYRLNRGTDALFERFERDGVIDVVSPNRSNVCSRKGWRLPWQRA